MTKNKFILFVVVETVLFLLLLATFRDVRVAAAQIKKLEQRMDEMQSPKTLLLPDPTGNYPQIDSGL